MQSPKRLVYLSVLFFLAFAAFTVAEAGAQTVQPKPVFNPAAESWIREQIVNEREADVAEQFPDKNSRVISSAFLFEILRNPPKGIYGSQVSVRIANVTVIGYLHLPNTDIPFSLQLRGCHFLDDVSFSESNFQRDLSFEYSIFEEAVNFYGMKVAGSLRALGCRFKKKTGNLDDLAVNFEYMQIGRNLSIFDAQFEGDVSFLRTRVGQVFDGDLVKFLDQDGSVKFEDIKVDGLFLIRNSEFSGTVSFRLADMTKDFDASNAKFLHPSKDVEFFGMVVGRNAFFTNAFFAGGARLLRMDIGGNLEFINVIAENSNRLKDFRSLKADELIFDGAQRVSKPYDLRGMSYRLIFGRVYEGDRPKDVLLDFVNGSRYFPSNPDNYTNLEAFYLTQGNLDGAKAVHIAWQKRELSELSFLRSPVACLWNLIRYVTTGYGQYLVLALVWSGIFIIVGYFFFRKEKWMETRNKDDDARFKNKYHPLWYSIALFLPVVSLQDKEIWVPRLNRRITRFYMRVHIILGYLLIPVGLAAWTGIIK